MDDFESKNVAVIDYVNKTLIKYLSDINDDARSRVYSKLQNAKYAYINSEEAKKMGAKITSVAFYSPKKNKIYFISDSGQVMPTNFLTHEMMHYLSDNTVFADKMTYDDIKVGLTLYDIEKRNVKTGGPIKHNVYKYCALNEGVTEFLTRKALKLSGGNNYLFQTDIISHISDVIGEDNIKNYYFNNDHKGLFKCIRKKYHLKNDELLEKLLLQMDIITNLNEHGKYIDTTFPTITACYETLLTMEVNRQMVENKSKIKTPIDVYKYFDIKNYLEKNSFVELKYKYLFDNMLIPCLLKNKSKLTQGIGKINYSKAYSFATDVITCLFEKKWVDVGYLRYYPDAVIQLMQYFNTNSGFYETLEDHQSVLLAKQEYIKKFLYCLRNEDKKIDLSGYTDKQKYDFISNVIYCPYDDKKEFYKLFNPKDLVKFINNDNKEYLYFADRDTMAYIKDELNNIDIIVKNRSRVFASLINDVLKGNYGSSFSKNFG